MTYCKHWLAYVRPITLLIAKTGVLLLVCFVVFPLRSGLIRELSSALGFEPGLASWVVTGFFALTVIVFLWSIALSLIYILELRQVRILVSEDSVEYWSGLFPWDQNYQRWYADQIYDASYRWASKYIGWALKYGTIIITSTEGTTRDTYIYEIAGVRRLAADIVNLSRSTR